MIHNKDYKEVEYIDLRGGSIETELIFNSYCIIQARLKITTPFTQDIFTSGVNGTDYYHVFIKTNRFCFDTVNNEVGNAFASINVLDLDKIYTLNIGNKYIADVNTGDYYLKADEASYFETDPLTICGAIFYSVKVMDANQDALAIYIPVRNLKTGVYGFYEEISDTFYTYENASGGDYLEDDEYGDIADNLNVIVMNTSFEMIAIIDIYTSLVWTDKFDEIGDFELELPYDKKYDTVFKKDYYCSIKASEKVMIIEDIKLEWREEEGAILQITGRSLESILERRVIYYEVLFGYRKTTSEGGGQSYTNTFEQYVNVQDSISAILNDNFINPRYFESTCSSIQGMLWQAVPVSRLLTRAGINPDYYSSSVTSSVYDTWRKFPNFIMKKCTQTAVTEATFADVVQSKGVYEFISELCKEKHFGFKVTLDDQQRFVFELYAGTDRSYLQNAAEYVLFSPLYDNVEKMQYSLSEKEYKNLLYVINEESKNSTSTTDDGSDPDPLKNKPCPVASSEYSSILDIDGFDRREELCNSGDLRREEEDYLTEDIIRKRGKLKLDKELKVKIAVEASVIPDIIYKYRKDYYLGDTVQVEDPYGHTAALYLSEVSLSRESGKISIVPTFTTYTNEWDTVSDVYNLPGAKARPVSRSRTYYHPIAFFTSYETTNYS